MSYETFLLAKTARASRGPNMRHLFSAHALKKAAGTKHRASKWVLESAYLPWLLQTPGQTKNDCLLLLDRPRPTQAVLLQARFAKVWAPGGGLSFLPKEELIEIIGSEDREGLFIGGVVDHDEQIILLLRGDVTVLEAPFRMFQASGIAAPDFSKFAIVDYGTAVSFGDYTATADSILYELDPKYRKKAKARRLEQDGSFGGSLKRLRMLRGLSQTDFEPAISAKQVARIESGRIKTPREATVKLLAKKLRVKPGDIATY